MSKTICLLEWKTLKTERFLYFGWKDLGVHVRVVWLKRRTEKNFRYKNLFNNLLHFESYTVLTIENYSISLYTITLISQINP